MHAAASWHGPVNTVCFFPRRDSYNSDVSPADFVFIPVDHELLGLCAAALGLEGEEEGVMRLSAEKRVPLTHSPERLGLCILFCLLER